MATIGFLQLATNLISSYQPRRSLKMDPAALEKITLTNQKNSPFLCLPGEIRNVIYEHWFGGYNIGIASECTHERDSTNKGRCTLPDFHGHGIIVMASPSRSTYYHRKMPVHPFYAPKFVGYMLTCKQIYEEAALFVFRFNRFAFWNSGTIDRWLSKRTLVQTALISRIELSGELFKELASQLKSLFPGLEKVFVRPSARFEYRIDQMHAEESLKEVASDVDVVWGSEYRGRIEWGEL